MCWKVLNSSSASKLKTIPNSSSISENNVTLATESQFFNEVVAAPTTSSGAISGNTTRKHFVRRSAVLFTVGLNHGMKRLQTRLLKLDPPKATGRERRPREDYLPEAFSWNIFGGLRKG